MLWRKCIILSSHICIPVLGLGQVDKEALALKKVNSDVCLHVAFVLNTPMYITKVVWSDEI